MIHINSAIQADIVLEPYNGGAKKLKLHSKKKERENPCIRNALFLIHRACFRKVLQTTTIAAISLIKIIKKC